MPQVYIIQAVSTRVTCIHYTPLTSTEVQVVCAHSTRDTFKHACSGCPGNAVYV